MIFWVMLLTFVISIMTLSLYPREDSVAVQEKPLAEVPVRPFLDMHNMARQTAERQLTNGTAGTGGEILKGSNLPLYTQDDVSDFRSFLVCNTAVANCDLAVGTCTLTRQEANTDHPCNGNNNVVCLAANCEADTSNNPQNPFVCNPVIIGSTDGSCPNGQQAEIMNFVVTVAPYQTWWNDINYGPSQSPAKQLWNGQLFKLSGRTGNCGVIWGDQIAHPRGTTPINNTVRTTLQNNNLARSGNMICQSAATGHPQPAACPPGQYAVYDTNVNDCTIPPFICVADNIQTTTTQQNGITITHYDYLTQQQAALNWNYWTAESYCQSHGMHLVTTAELNTFNPGGPYIIGSLRGWLQSSPNNCQADRFGGYMATDKFEEDAEIVGGYMATDKFEEDAEIVACVPD